MDLQDVFISNLKRFRKEQYITQEKLAELCNTDTSYIGQIETRRRFPSLSFIEKIAVSLNIPAYLLFKPIDYSETNKNSDIKNELASAITKDIYEIFLKHGMV